VRKLDTSINPGIADVITRKAPVPMGKGASLFTMKGQ